MASCEVTGVLYKGGGNQVAPRAARGFSARRRRENFGDIDCKSLHLGPEIDATHTLLTATYMYDSMSTDNFDDTLATMTKATVSLPYPPALSTAWPGSIAKLSLK